MDNVLQEAFLNGLKPTLKAEVVSKHPVGLEVCMKEAQMQADRAYALKLAQEEGSNRTT